MAFESILKKAGEGLEGLLQGQERSHGHAGNSTANRYQSFAPQSSGGAKWYVDGASYFWAVSEALENASETIYILDWWLTPELYLRRPPSANEQYRLDRMLQAAANRGVKIHVIVYKEVEKALTLNSAHTRHALEALSPNIGVFRHPDHIPTGDDIEADFKNLSLSNLDLGKASGEALQSLFGMSGDMVLFWAHHEKLLVIDERIAFMGGLDMCFGRWDTSSHPIADSHPGNVDGILFPGQDYNNARIFDFADVDKWEDNKLDRTKSSRMGWSDVSIRLDGRIVNNLVDHFVDRWNYIFESKYSTKDDGKYHRLGSNTSSQQHHAPAAPGSSGDDGGSGVGDLAGRLLGGLQHHVQKHLHQLTRDGGDGERGEGGSRSMHGGDGGGGGSGVHIQLCRSCTNWSSGHDTEHSIANAYIAAISEARHFVYIENQFFITATSDEQRPVMNRIGAAIADRIVRAYHAGEDFRVMVLMPAVPAFAGDLHADGALGTRAIMEYQYNSICRGGNSIMDVLRRAGIDDAAMGRYIGFYNLRNYDRINVSTTMSQAEHDAGVSYETARKEHDDYVGAGFWPQGEGTQGGRGRAGADSGTAEYDRYQQAASRLPDQTWDTVSSCYMEMGPRLDSAPWQGSPESELDAFVSEELYIHTKVLIADDRLVICGSANLNDRSQLGTHDSEIAVVIEDTDMVDSFMGGRPYRASRFAASLRRYLHRKHLGLIPDQRWDQPTANWTPHGINEYDWGSPADRLVQDPLGPEYLRLWAETARQNTDVFSKVFHNVPNDRVRTWADYDDFFTRYFIIPGATDDDQEEKRRRLEEAGGGDLVEYGHVVRSEFPGGVEEVKQWLGRVRGTVVEMPLQFLAEVDDIAKEGLTLNGLTDELYT